MTKNFTENENAHEIHGLKYLLSLKGEAENFDSKLSLNVSRISASDHKAEWRERLLFLIDTVDAYQLLTRRNFVDLTSAFSVRWVVSTDCYAILVQEEQCAHKVALMKKIVTLYESYRSWSIENSRRHTLSLPRVLFHELRTLLPVRQNHFYVAQWPTIGSCLEHQLFQGYMAG